MTCGAFETPGICLFHVFDIPLGFIPGYVCILFISQELVCIYFTLFVFRLLLLYFCNFHRLWLCVGSHLVSTTPCVLGFSSIRHSLCLSFGRDGLFPTLVG